MSAALSLALAATLLHPGKAPAQTPPAGPGNTALKPGSAQRYLVQGLVFEGRTAMPEDELQALAAPFLGRPLRYDDLEDLRQRLTQAYIGAGYVSSGALLSGFDATTGTLQVRIVEGRVTAVQVQGGGGLSQQYVAQRLSRPGEVFQVQALEDRFRTLLVDPLFARLDVRVLPGAAQGDTVLAVDATRAAPVEATLFANNQQAPSVGATGWGAEFTARNFSGWGDAANLALTRHAGGTNVDAGWTLPLRAGRTLLSARVSRAHASVVEEPLAQLDVDSVVQGREWSLSHPLIEDAQTRWLAGVLQSERRNRTTLGGEPFSFVAGEETGATRVSAVRLFQDWLQRDGGRVLALRSTYTRGRNSLSPEPRLDEQAPRSFQTLLLQAQAVWPLGEAGGSQLLGRFSAQFTPDRLLPLEQFSVGGRQTVRGYRENELVRDRGWVLNAEWRAPWTWGEAAWQRLTLLGFVDAGEASNVGGARNRLVSVGLGALWQLAGLDVDIQWGHALRDQPRPAHRNLQDHGLHLSLRWRAAAP